MEDIMSPSRLTGKIEEVGVFDVDINSFYAKQGNTTLIARQPRPEDYKRVKEAQKQTSDRTFNRFLTVQEQRRTNWAKWVCNRPLFKKGQLGKIHLIMEMNNRIVGFAGIVFKKASDFKIHHLPEPDTTAAYVSLCIIDAYQGRGIGTLFAHLSEFIDIYFGAEWGVATTYARGGTLGIRQKSGWKVVHVLQGAPGGGQVCLTKRLGG
jgi:GNAT superfamily N-acetyltransferase